MGNQPKTTNFHQRFKGLPPPPPPPEPEPQQDQPQVMFSQDIDKVSLIEKICKYVRIQVVNSVNQNTAAFQRPGESYDKVIQIMSSYFNRKSGSQYVSHFLKYFYKISYAGYKHCNPVQWDLQQ